MTVIQSFVFLAYCSVAFACNMAPWKETLQQAGVPEEIADKILAKYPSEEIFRSCFRTESDLDKFAKTLLLGTDPPLATEEDWSFQPMTGALRRVRESLIAPEPSPPASLLPLMPFPPPAVAGNHRLNEADRESLVKKFGKNFPGVHLHPAVLPSLPYLQLVQQQCRMQAWAWTPWRKILSEEAIQEVVARRGARKREMVDLVAEAAGLCTEEWDLDTLSAPLEVLHLLCVRAHAYAMNDAGHLHSWMAYVNKFLFYYSKRPGAGLRMISSAEAEEADKEAMCEIFHMVYHEGASLDDALETIVREDLLRRKLVHMPKPLASITKAPKGPAGKRLQEKDKFDKEPLKRRRAEPQKRPCHAWKKDGKCKFGDECKFLHGESQE